MNTKLLWVFLLRNLMHTQVKRERSMFNKHVRRGKILANKVYIIKDVVCLRRWFHCYFPWKFFTYSVVCEAFNIRYPLPGKSFIMRLIIEGGILAEHIVAFFIETQYWECFHSIISFRIIFAFRSALVLWVCLCIQNIFIVSRLLLLKKHLRILKLLKPSHVKS